MKELTSEPTTFFTTTPVAVVDATKLAAMGVELRRMMDECPAAVRVGRDVIGVLSEHVVEVSGASDSFHGLRLFVDPCLARDQWIVMNGRELREWQEKMRMG